jgi:hypothetical protein
LTIVVVVVVVVAIFTVTHCCGWRRLTIG